MEANDNVPLDTIIEELRGLFRACGAHVVACGRQAHAQADVEKLLNLLEQAIEILEQGS